MDKPSPEATLRSRGGRFKKFQSETSKEGASQPLRIVYPTELDGVPVPERKWIVQGWLPVGHVTIDFGDGGTGKTLLAQQLMTATALGTPWCGLAVEPCKSFGLFCEDDEDELHRRQDDILANLRLPFTELRNMRWASSVGADNVLVRYDRDGIGTPTQRLAEITREAVLFGARLVVLDTAADLFGGNENDRAQVRNFVGAHLGNLARTINGAVLLNAHPSKSGMSATGDMTSGSTGWSNTARSRWSLSRPEADGDQQPDVDERVLTKRKSNYAAIGDQIGLRWERGVLVPQRGVGGGASAFDARARADEAENVFLELLDRCTASNQMLSDKKTSGNWAPRTLAKRPDARGFKTHEFDAAMSRLFATSRISLAKYGRPADWRYRIIRVVQSSSDEAEDGPGGGSGMPQTPVAAVCGGSNGKAITH